MKPAYPHILNIKPYVSGKPIAQVQRDFGLKSVIKLASNENPYPPSARVLAAIHKAAQASNRYPDSSCFLLRKALAKRHGVEEGQILFGNGSDEVIVLAVRAFVAAGDEVIVAYPSFLIYEIAASVVGAKIHAVPLRDFHYDIAGMKAKISRRTRMIFIGNPDNPAGTFVPGPILEDLIEAASQDTLILIDEAYFEYVVSRDYPDGMDFVKKYPNVLVTRTFSKMYGLAGLRIGYGVGHADVIGVMQRLREPFNVNALAQAAALAALADRGHYKKIAQDIAEQRRYLYQALESMGVSYVRSSTNFILIHTKRNSAALAKALLEKGVIIRDMSAWGLRGYIRVSMGTRNENRRFIETLKESL